MIATSLLAFFHAATRVALSCCRATSGRIALAGFLASIGSSAFAQTTTTWTSPSDTTFATGANWNSGAPANDLISHIALFSTGSLANPVLTASQSVAGLTISTATTFSATNGASLTVGASNIGVSNTSGTVVISAPLAGTASLTKSGAGVLTLSGANTHSGGTNLSAGTLNLAHASAVGSGAFGFAPASITLDNTSGGALTLSTNNPLNFNGAASTLTFTGTNSLNLGTGAVTLSANIGTIIKTFTVSASTLTLGGDISGTAALRKLGNGALVLNGATSFAGGLTVSGGTVTLNGASTRTGTNIVNTGATLNINHASALGTGTLAFNTTPKIDNTSGAAITLTTNNAQIWNSNFTFIGTNSLNLGTGAITMLSSRQITVNGSTLTVGGAISDGGGLTKLGAGTLVLGGENLYNGATAVNAGTLLVTGSLAGSPVTVNSGAKLGGTGTINGETIIASGGTLTPGDGPGRLTFASNVTLADGSISNFQINGTVRGTTFDAIDLTTGWLAYGGTLNLDFSSTIAGGHTLDLFNLSDQGAGGSFSSIVASGSYGGLFTNNDGVWTLDSGLQTLTFDQTTGDLFITGVPEPSTYAALLGAAALGLAAWRRRNRPVA